MESSIVRLKKNFTLVMAGNLFSMLVSVVVTFLIPHFFDENAYSYFCLENLYCGYLWILSLGWTDGIFLKYGGKTKDELPAGSIKSQFLAIGCYLIVIGALISAVFWGFGTDADKLFVAQMSLVSVMIEIMREVLSSTLQATNQMKKYAGIIFLDRCFYLVLVVVLIARGTRDYKLLIGADIFSKALTLACAIVIGKDLLSGKLEPAVRVWREIREFISTGIFISASSYAGRLINGIIRAAVEWKWGLIAFGKLSLTFTISNFFTKFVSAVSVVLFPELRRTSDEKRVEVYELLSVVLSVVMLFLFCFFVPGSRILLMWLPGYKESIRYVSLLLPISLFETKLTMLVNTYLKVIRKEREILYANLLAVVLCGIFTFLSVGLFSNMDLAVVCAFGVYAFRCLWAEHRLGTCISIHTDSRWEIIMSVLFVWINWRYSDVTAMVIYMVLFVGYIWVNRNKIKAALQRIRMLKG
jgi:O-antigen/teichoic acid export membrane protein